MTTSRTSRLPLLLALLLVEHAVPLHAAIPPPESEPGRSGRTDCAPSEALAAAGCESAWKLPSLAEGAYVTVPSASTPLDRQTAAVNGNAPGRGAPQPPGEALPVDLNQAAGEAAPGDADFVSFGGERGSAGAADALRLAWQGLAGSRSPSTGAVATTVPETAQTWPDDSPELAWARLELPMPVQEGEVTAGDDVLQGYWLLAPFSPVIDATGSRDPHASVAVCRDILSGSSEPDEPGGDILKLVAIRADVCSGIALADGAVPAPASPGLLVVALGAGLIFRRWRRLPVLVRSKGRTFRAVS